MKRSKIVWALVALNVLLLLCLAGQWLKPNLARAQAAAPRVSDYILVPGSVQASPAQVVYIIDTQNGWLSARTATAAGGARMMDAAAIDLKSIFERANNPGAGQRPPRGRAQ